MQSSQFSNPDFNHDNNFDVVLQCLNLLPPVRVILFGWKFVVFEPKCGILMDQNCQKVLLVPTNSGIHTFNSQYIVSLHSFLFEADCSFLLVLKIDVFIGIGILVGRKGKTAFSSDKSRSFYSSLSKSTALNFCIKLWSDAFRVLHDSYTEDSVVLFIIMPSSASRLPSTTFFLLKKISVLTSIVVCSVYHFCAALMRNMAMRLRLLFALPLISLSLC